MVRVLFAGTPEAAVPSLRKLAHDTEHFEVVAVLTRPDAPTGRGRKLMPSPVKQAALELGLPVMECDPGEEAFLAALKATGAEPARSWHMDVCSRNRCSTHCRWGGITCIFRCCRNGVARRRCSARSGPGNR